MRGIILRERGDELVIRPTDAEVTAFGTGAAVTVQAPVDEAISPQDLVGQPLYDAHGREVMVVQTLTLDASTRGTIDITCMGDTATKWLAPARPRTALIGGVLRLP